MVRPRMGHDSPKDNPTLSKKSATVTTTKSKVTPTPMHANPYAQQIAFPVISQPVPRWDYSSATTRCAPQAAKYSRSNLVKMKKSAK